MTGTRILVLEDDDDLATFYSEALRELGHTVTVCTRFEHARKRLYEDPPDAVLTDIRVGEYNGLHLAWLFRAMSPNGTVVVVSGYDDVVLQKEAELLNAEFLLKPVDMCQLQTRFCGLLRPPLSEGSVMPGAAARG